jgi:hypothetical protein
MGDRVQAQICLVVFVAQVRKALLPAARFPEPRTTRRGIEIEEICEMQTQQSEYRVKGLLTKVVPLRRLRLCIGSTPSELH